MNHKEKNSIAILGLGKVGTATGYLLRKAGYPIVAVASRTESSLLKGVSFTGGKAYSSFSDAASHADTIIIATSDDAILSTCTAISHNKSILQGKKVIHMSGAGSLNLLDPAKNSGAYVGCIHPLQSFADVENAIKNLPGSSFGITVQDEIKEWAVQIVQDIGGFPFFVADNDKALYHAAACIASNYLTTLIHVAEEIYISLGLTRESALRSLWPLVRGTLANIEQKGSISALTGPVVRGDTGTITNHLVALDSFHAYLPAYCIMGMLAADIGVERKTLSEEEAESIKELLRKGLKNE